MSYRAAALRCPACPGQLEEQIRGALHVDACRDCGGLFIDWLDGSVGDVVNRVVTPPEATGTQQGGDGACPHCNVGLEPEVAGDTTTILRCGSCAGAFVSRHAFNELRGRAAARADQRTSVDPFLTRVLDALENGQTFGK